MRNQLSDEDIRKCSKQKVRYQKAMARIFVKKTSDDVSDTAQGVGKNVETEINTVLSNSFGFGGTNSALVIKKIYNGTVSQDDHVLEFGVKHKSITKSI